MKVKFIPGKGEKQEGVYEPDYLTEAIRAKIRRLIEHLLEEEIDIIIKAGHYCRSEERTGYRHGYESRTIGTSLGQTSFDCPRARLFNPGAGSREWQSQILPRYKRRAKAVDDAIIGTYLSGVNTRRVKQALKPLLKDVPLSSSAVSRLVGRLKESFEAWQNRSLSDERFIYLYADAIFINVRIGYGVSKVPILTVVGVRENGEKELLALALRGSESESAWYGVLKDLVDRGLSKPSLIIVDGSKGLLAAVEKLWPGIDIQRCIVHKLQNILGYVPDHLHEEIKVDFQKIVYAESLEDAKQAYDRFVQKWRKRCEGVVKSLEEAGDELLTFFKFPKSQWKSLRTTNIIEKLEGEFRRRIKTQSSFPNESSVLVLLFGLYASGQIRMRKLNGWKDLSMVLRKVA